MLAENSCELFLLPYRFAQRPLINHGCLPSALYTANVLQHLHPASPLRRPKSAEADQSSYASPFFRASSIMDGYKQEVKGHLMHQRRPGSMGGCFVRAAPCPAPSQVWPWCATFETRRQTSRGDWAMIAHSDVSNSPFRAPL